MTTDILPTLNNAKNRLKVLCVDDEVNILKALQRLLRQEPYELFVSDSPEKALELIQHNTFALVVSDQRMPGIDGVSVLQQVSTVSPETVRILLTGYSDVSDAIRSINDGAVYRYLNKPWNDEELKVTFRQAVSQFEMIQLNLALHNLIETQNAELQELNQTLEKRVLDRTEELSKLNISLKENFMSAIQVMSKLAEFHSNVLGSHAKRVANLCYTLAQRLNLSDSQVSQIVIAATLHDVGKVAIPTKLLNKQEQHLTPDEIELMRGHAIMGEKLVSMIPNLQKEALLIRHHHERMDGNGYPEGLKGENIPLGARIIAVVDAYDKLLHQQASADEAIPEKIVSSLRHKMPGKFDPFVLDALYHCLEGSVIPQAHEQEINLDKLKPGMRFSRDLITVSGERLMPKDEILETAQLGLLQKFLAIDPPKAGIFIYRETEQKAESFLENVEPMLQTAL